MAITDSDKPALTLSRTELTIAEGEESNELTIRLTSEPSANVTVTLAQPSNADVRVDTDPSDSGNQNTLTFTPANWRVPQAVRVAAAEDDDADPDDADIVITASGGGYNIGAGAGNNVDVTVTDPDEPAITVSTSYLAINETESGTFTVRLATQPRASVTVTLAQPSNTDVTVDDTDSNTSGNQNTLTFTTTNWNTAQTVTVSAADDSGDSDANDTATITISAADGGYGDADDVTVKITVGDDEASKVLASIEGLNIEEGEQESFRVRLTKEPTAAVTVTVAQPSPNPEITIDTNSGSSGNQNTLAFDDNNWDDWQTVTVSVASDGDDQQDVGNIVISAEGGGYTATDSADNVTVTVMDDDEKGITLTASTLTVAEGQSVPLGIRLSAVPNGAVTVTLTQPQNTDVTIDTDAQTAGNQRTLTFTASNWDREQEVSVSAAQDNDASEDSATIVISVTGSNYTTTPPIEDVEVSVRVTESDTAAMTVSPASLEIVEGEGATITVSLSAPPSPSTENVTVALTRTGSTSVIFTPQTLIFTSSNWSTARSVGVIAAHDEDETDDSATITLRASGGGYDDIAAGSVSVAVEDDDAPGITTFPRSLTIAEEQSGFFVVRLSKEPSADVTLTLGQPANTDVTLDTDPSTPGNQNTLAFTTKNWRTPQGVSVSVTADSNSQTDTTSIPISATGATEYTNVTAQVAVEAIEDVNPNQPLTWTIRSSAPAIPPPSAQDSSTLRVRCLEGGKACNVYFDCSAQDGTRYHGPTPHLTIDSWNTQIL
ncbi:MAG: hypothetical protein ISN28_09225, partial [Ectothiorhodospiraceae bacterium AqS1]|nr:hypothetical protein [Ectothiorhodospiraceae bacterium AqS1]